jgi:death-on-curing protein
VSAPAFLSVGQVERLNRKSIERFGGIHGVRDRGLLESAVLQPQNVHYYGGGGLFEVAAAYCYHIAEAQAFLDGNKRTAVAAALTFLEVNGVSTDFDSMPLYDAMIAIAEKRMSRQALADLLRTLCGKE